MYLGKVQLENIRGFEEFAWEVPAGEEAGWHVLLGDNGCGKSTVLKAIALALIPARDHPALLEDWSRWPRRGSTEAASIELELRKDAEVDYLDASRPLTKGSSAAVQTLDKSVESVTARIEFVNAGAQSHTEGTGSAEIGPWSGAQGWFWAAYGPFRRFSGGDPDESRIQTSYPRVGAGLTVFNERFALGEARKWIRELDHQRKDQRPEGALLDALIVFINESNLLPHNVRIDAVDSEGVWCMDAEGARLELAEMSDGYRSQMSLTFELIRQIARCFGPERVFDRESPARIDLPGVVLIDEVDAHLHPTWQHRIGEWFTSVFPRMQFLVTTHSPIVCQAARTVWALPNPGESDLPRRVEGQDLNRLRYGSILDAFSTGVFGEGVTRSEEGKKRLQRLAELNAKDLDLKLTAGEHKEREGLRESTPTAASRLPEMLKKVVP